MDLATGKTIRKLSAGHAGSVRLLSFSPDGRYLASSASSARFANVFDVAASAEPPSEPVCTLGFAATPAFLALHASSSDGGGGDEVTLVAGFDTGGVSVLRTRRQPSGKKGAAFVYVHTSCVRVWKVRAPWGKIGICLFSLGAHGGVRSRTSPFVFLSLVYIYLCSRRSALTVASDLERTLLSSFRSPVFCQYLPPEKLPGVPRPFSPPLIAPPRARTSPSVTLSPFFSPPAPPLRVCP